MVMLERIETNLSTKLFVKNLETEGELKNIGEGGFDFAFTINGPSEFNSSVGHFTLQQVYTYYDENLGGNKVPFMFIYFM